MGVSDDAVHTALHPPTSASDASLRPARYTNHLLALGREVNECCLAILALTLASGSTLLLFDCVVLVDDFGTKLNTYSISYTTLAS